MKIGLAVLAPMAAAAGAELAQGAHFTPSTPDVAALAGLSPPIRDGMRELTSHGGPQYRAWAHEMRTEGDAKVYVDLDHAVGARDPGCPLEENVTRAFTWFDYDTANCTVNGTQVPTRIGVFRSRTANGTVAHYGDAMGNWQATGACEGWNASQRLVGETTGWVLVHCAAPAPAAMPDSREPTHGGHGSRLDSAEKAIAVTTAALTLAACGGMLIKYGCRDSEVHPEPDVELGQVPPAGDEAPLVGVQAAVEAGAESM